MNKIDFARYHARLAALDPVKIMGTINRAVGLVIESQGPPVRVGDLCDIIGDSPAESATVEVIGFKENTVLSMPLGKLDGIRLGKTIVARNKPPTVKVSPRLLGRVLD